MRKNKEVERLLAENKAIRQNLIDQGYIYKKTNQLLDVQSKELKELRHKSLREGSIIEALQYALRLMQLEIRRLQLETNETNFMFANGKWEKLVEDNLALGV